VPEETNLAVANAIHQRIHALCFVARSVNFPVDYSASYETKRNTNETP
jgi:organic hydroperoxide reductase OsmC/OhrA